MTKQLHLEIDEEMRSAVRGGAPFVGVEIAEYESFARGVCLAVGTEEECHAAFRPGIRIVPDNIKVNYEFQVWDADYVREALEQ